MIDFSLGARQRIAFKNCYYTEFLKFLTSKMTEIKTSLRFS